MLTSRTEENLKLAKEEIEKTATGSVAYCLLDQTKNESIAAAVKTTRETFGSISILVNNSGGLLLEISKILEMKTGKKHLSLLY